MSFNLNILDLKYADHNLNVIISLSVKCNVTHLEVHQQLINKCTHLTLLFTVPI